MKNTIPSIRTSSSSAFIQRYIHLILLLLACWFTLSPASGAIISDSDCTISEVIGTDHAAANILFTIGVASLKRTRRIRRNSEQIEACSAMITSAEIPKLSEEGQPIEIAIVS